MAIEQFVKHIESLHDSHSKSLKHSGERKDLGKQGLTYSDESFKHNHVGSTQGMKHLSADLVKLKDMLKKVLATRQSSDISHEK